jgi:uncharacterized oxidoreductase
MREQAMRTTGNTMLVTGGGSGIGRELAEAFHRAGNRVIVAGRRREALDEVAAANPGLETAVLDVADAAAVQAFAAELVRKHPELDVLVNNAGIMLDEDLTADPVDLAAAEATVATNLLGPIRLTAALLPHLRRRPGSAIVNVTSGLAFVPLARNPTYSATKAALHSYSQSLRQQLAGQVEVIEIVPPYVQTRLQGERNVNDPAAMPLDAFIAETLDILRRQPTPAEVCVERVKFLRNAEAEGRHDQAFQAMNSH